MIDNDPSAADPFGQIADEFVEAFRQGQRPSVEEFARRYPEHADDIREMLPALVLMEKAKSADDTPGQQRQAKGPAAAPPLRQLGDYQILREVGRGGMGVVYEAQQLSLGRHVAIKVLPPHALLDARQLGRFQREARSAAKLHHTNIVPVFGVGEQDGLHYYVMQFIPGLGLDLDRRPKSGLDFWDVPGNRHLSSVAGLAVNKSTAERTVYLPDGKGLAVGTRDHGVVFTDAQGVRTWRGNPPTTIACSPVVENDRVAAWEPPSPPLYNDYPHFSSRGGGSTAGRGPSTGRASVKEASHIGHDGRVYQLLAAEPQENAGDLALPLSRGDGAPTLWAARGGVSLMAEVALEHVGKHYTPGAAALDDLTLTVADGELLVLVGPSGCGKTTTLRLIAGLETLTTGTIRIDGRVVNDLPPRSRDVALVFQRPTLYPHLSVADNLAFGVRMREGDPVGRWFGRLFHPAAPPGAGADLGERVRETAGLLGLTDLLNRRPSQLSGGQQQRVALGRALVRRPAVFLLDEPLSNLDPTLRHEMRRELHLLQRRLRATMIYVTHDQVEAMTLGDRVVVLDRGRVQQAGRPLELYERPANRFVAGFIGWPPMNFFDGRLVRRDGGELALAVGGRELPLPAATFGPLVAYNGGDVTAGIRPESVKVGEGIARADWTMDVLLVEPLGSATLVTLGRDGRQLLALTAGRPAVKERQTVEVGLDVKHLHLFDRSSGAVLLSG